MKAKVIVRFGCKETKKVYEVGSEFDGSAERIAELIKKGKVEVKEKVEVEKTKEKKEVKPQGKKEK